MTAHSNILVWRIPWTEEPGGLQSWASLVAQLVKNPPAMWETWIRSLDWEDPLEKEMATHSNSLGWENSMDVGAWQATVHGITKRWTGLSNFTGQKLRASV